MECFKVFQLRAHIYQARSLLGKEGQQSLVYWTGGVCNSAPNRQIDVKGGW